MDEDTRNKIALNFQANINRVSNLVDAYDALGTPGAGRPTVRQTDLLRASVVLLHATLEDVLRSISEHLLPLQGPDVLDKVGFPAGSDKTQPKFTLGDLYRFKGRSVEDVIQAAVVTSLQRSNYNSVSEASAALERIGLSADLLDPEKGAIESIMKRRHLIVHRADKNPTGNRGRGVPLTQHLAKRTVETWMEIVRGTGTRIIGALGTT